MTKKRGVEQPIGHEPCSIRGRLISDTHGLLRPEIAKAFAGVRLILHAGDVGGARCSRPGGNRAGEAVYGNVDDRAIPRWARERVATIGGIRSTSATGTRFGGRRPRSYSRATPGDVVIFGHTHRAALLRDGDGAHRVQSRRRGAARFDLLPSVARLTIANGTAEGRDYFAGVNSIVMSCSS